MAQHHWTLHLEVHDRPCPQIGAVVELTEAEYKQSNATRIFICIFTGIMY